MSILRYTLCVVLVLFLSGCGSAVSEAEGADSPDAADERAASETLSAMLALAEEGNWGGYVDQHYGEAHKFRTLEDRNALVWRFEQRWGAKVIEALRRAANVTPAIESNRALFMENGDPLFILHREEDGTWTFHL